MSKKLIYLFCLVLVLGPVGKTLADVYWEDGDPSDHLWTTPGNWRDGVVPGINDKVRIKDIAEVSSPIVDANMVGPNTVRVGCLMIGEAAGLATLKMTGGRAHVGGGTHEDDGWMGIANSVNPSLSKLDMSGGTLATDGSLRLARRGLGRINMTGDSTALNISGSFKIGASIADPNTGIGDVDLQAGTINASTFGIYQASTGSMDITDGLLVVDGNVVPTINEYVGDDRITAYAGARQVVARYSVGKTRVAAEGSPALARAWNPNPYSGESVALSLDELSWALPEPLVQEDIVKCDVLFGTDPNMDTFDKIVDYDDVESTTNFSPVVDQTYYWQVDCYDPNGGSPGGPNEVKTDGFIWTFTTDLGPGSPEKATNPHPSHEATGVDLNTDLIWSPGWEATSHDVFLGTDCNDVNDANDSWPVATGPEDPNVYKGNQLSAVYYPTGLPIDFPIDWTSLDVLADEWLNDCNSTNNWCNGADLNRSGNVDFDDFASFARYCLEGYLEPDTTYCWRIDGKNAIGTTKGDLWSFTTASRTASIVSPGDGTKVDIDVDLVWNPGAGGIYTHDVYFGTNFNDVNDANNLWPVATGPNDPNVYKGNQTSTTFDPGVMDYDTAHYWRIDEVKDSNVWKGQVWGFTTGATRPAFPTAEGPGMWTIGGRGGQVLKVINLDDSGAGSLRAAVQASGPRIVIFDVSGTITLQSTLKVTNPYITIAGQTAPGDGITLKDYEFKVEGAEDVIVRYIRCRPGDNFAHPGPDPPRYEPDSLAVTESNNVMIDHVSASWSVDETLSVTHSNDVTVQWCMISESLNDSEHHDPEPHGYASLINQCCDKEVTYHHNLYAHHKTRCPRPQNTNGSDPNGWTFDFRNNVIYSWLDSTPGYNTDTDPPKISLVNFIGNYYKNGNERTSTEIFKQQYNLSKGYFSDNSLDGNTPPDPWSLVRFQGFTEEQIEEYKQDGPFDVVAVATDGPSTAYTRVMADVGANLPARDPVDVRVINDIKNKTGQIIDDEDEVGGWPTLYSLTTPADSDNDGMPNYWEEQYNGSLVPNGDLDGDGYTNIEEYLNNTDPNGSSDTIVYIGASISRAYEVGETPGEFTVYRTGDTGSALIVGYTAGGSATSGDDYTPLGSSVTIPGSVSSATITVTPVNDPNVEGPEQVIVSIDPNDDYKLGLPREALVVIEDDD